MRLMMIMALLGAILVWGVGGARADEAAPGGAPAASAPPPDPTRGQWDSFLDPLRDVEDNYVSAGQKWIEDRSKVHVAAGISESWNWSFNTPPNGAALPYDNFLTQNSGSVEIGQLRANRPSEGWFVPGFGLTLTFGKTARRIKSDWNGDGAVNRGDTFETNNFDAEEAYLTWTVPDDSPALKGLSVKGGKFVTLLGAEVIEPWSNFNHSRSLLFSFAIPFTNTGALVTYPITDKLSVTGGPVLGWDEVASNNNGWTGMGNITYAMSDMVTAAANGIWGPQQNNTTSNKRGVADFVATIKPTSALTLLANYDWGQEQGAAIGGGTAIWQGFALVANYAFTDRFSGALRSEFFNDFNGARTGIKQRVYEWTASTKYLITQHLYLQGEFRQDYSNKNAFQRNTNGLADDNPLISISATYTFL
jgi:putative OmpL-like beta-barrel porin-2